MPRPNLENEIQKSKNYIKQGNKEQTRLREAIKNLMGNDFSLTSTTIHQLPNQEIKKIAARILALDKGLSDFDTSIQTADKQQRSRGRQKISLASIQNINNQIETEIGLLAKINTKTLTTLWKVKDEVKKASQEFQQGLEIDENKLTLSNLQQRSSNRPLEKKSEGPEGSAEDDEDWDQELEEENKEENKKENSPMNSSSLQMQFKSHIQNGDEEDFDFKDQFKDQKKNKP